MKFHEQLYQLKAKAIAVTLQNMNFVHTVEHTCNVYQNGMTLYRAASLRWSKEDLLAFKLALFWHDTGRIDREERESEPHQQRSARLFATAAADVNLDAEVVEKAVGMILLHRNRGATRPLSADDIGARALWDSDKLDIFNPSRCEEILAAYDEGIQAGEFSIEGSRAFWLSLEPEFEQKFHFDWSRAEFQRRYSEFSEWRRQRLPLL